MRGYKDVSVVQIEGTECFGRCLAIGGNGMPTETESGSWFSHDLKTGFLL